MCRVFALSEVFLMIAMSTETATAIQIRLLTLLGEVPKKRLIRRCCLIHLKNSSICPAMVVKGRNGQRSDGEASLILKIHSGFRNAANIQQA